jgi:Tol biopolymer transport system component
LVSHKTLEVRTLDTNGVTSIRVSWSPDGRYIAYRRGNPANGMRGEIYAFDLTGGPLLNFGPGEGPAWSPDGKEIAFIRDADVWVRTIETGAERQLTFTPNFSEEGMELVEFALCKPNDAFDQN